jgi:AcrR family transcriptional regulator
MRQTNRPDRSEPPAVDASRAAATRGAIMAVAERLFRSMGYQKTTVADIAREMSMSPANVYRFFPSKLAINEAICNQVLGGYADALWAVARGAGAAPDRLRALFLTAHRQSMALFFQDKRLHDMVDVAMAQHWSAIEGFIAQWEGAIRHIIMDGQRAGDFAGLPPDEIAMLVHSTMIGFSHPTLISQCADDDLQALAVNMAEFVLRALRP